MDSNSGKCRASTLKHLYIIYIIYHRVFIDFVVLLLPITARLSDIKPVCAFLCMCCLRPTLTWRLWALRFLSCWRSQTVSLVAAHLCLTLLLLTLILTLSLSVTTVACRCVTLYCPLALFVSASENI